MNNHQLSGFYSRLFFIIFLLCPPILAQAVTHDVSVRNNFFTPNDLTIDVGDTVRWTNNSGFHDVTADDGSFNSVTSNGFTFSRTFNSIAEILYYCAVHSAPGLDINSNMNIEFTSGGIFDTASVIQRTDPPGSDGTLKLIFENCNEGTIDYDITTIGASGTIPIQRVVIDNVALCDALLRESLLTP